ncbi:MAG: hypothetical protein HYV27_21960 [Candidatus Hydrogenedentes bacterium]|nr:hypothetical protein [Candidatus Hydrogenedentota bacterium]
MRMLVMVLALLIAGGVGAQRLEVMESETPEGKFVLRWGAPIGWSSNHGDVCGDANDEDPTLALIHAGVPAGVQRIAFSGKVNVEGLDPALKLAPGLFTLQFNPTALGMAATREFAGGGKGWQSFSLEGAVTKETAAWLLIPVFKIRLKTGPDDSLAPNADDHSRVLIDDVQVSFDGKPQLSNGGFENGKLEEVFADFMGLKAWRGTDCVDRKIVSAATGAAEK